MVLKPLTLQATLAPQEISAVTTPGRRAMGHLKSLINCHGIITLLLRPININSIWEGFTFMWLAVIQKEIVASRWEMAMVKFLGFFLAPTSTKPQAKNCKLGAVSEIAHSLANKLLGYEGFWMQFCFPSAVKLTDLEDILSQKVPM